MNSETGSEFVQLNETRRRIYEAIEFLNDVSFPRRMQRLLMQYEASVRQSFEMARSSPLKSRKVARILSGLTEIIYTMSSGLQHDHKYCERMCNIIAYYIACELCAAQEQIESVELIVNRIKLAIKTYVKPNIEHLLRTFVGIPMLFYRSDIITELNTTFLFAQWQKDEKIVQIELSDKIYIQYILIFYHWQSLMYDEAKKEIIIEFADQFMRPSRSLTTNDIYAEYLPKYCARSTATRYILEHLNHTTSQSLHVASKVDNRMQFFRGEEVSTSDEEENGSQQLLKDLPLSKVSKASSFSSQINEDENQNESLSTDQPASLPNTENDYVTIACDCSNYLLETGPTSVLDQNQLEAVTPSPSQHLSSSVETGETVDMDDISTCVLYSDTQFPGTVSASTQLIYPAQKNFHSSSSSETLIQMESVNDCNTLKTRDLTNHTDSSKSVNCLSSNSSEEPIRWQACKKVLISTDMIPMVFAPSTTCSSVPTEISSPVDLNKLEIKAHNYQFKRQKFFRLGKAHNKFYKDLLSMQRKNLRHLKEDQQLHLIRQATKRARQLRDLNNKRRYEAEQLENHLAAIRNSEHTETI